MIGIIDYGIGNIRSLRNGLEFVDREKIAVVKTPEEVLACDKIVLPGVGAFRPAITRIRERCLDQAILEKARAGNPVLGICLGMQLMAESSLENGLTQGLGLIEGTVKPLECQNNVLPHMGWNGLSHDDGYLFEGLKQDLDLYFLHSFHVVPDDPRVVVATTDYEVEFVSAIQKDNVCGIQPHPEKSQINGLRLLENFQKQ